jgi:biotin synthase
MDPWEVVKWIAIFRLILPEALFRLCGGRVENLGELQATAVKAGLNGVMMGNFLTTLGNTPDEDRAMFEELGLNVARQSDNGANPRPDNRSGWLDGETPDLVGAALEQPPDPPGLTVRLWNPASQLRFERKRAVPPRPDGAPNTGQGRATREAAARRATAPAATAPAATAPAATAPTATPAAPRAGSSTAVASNAVEERSAA